MSDSEEIIIEGLVTTLDPDGSTRIAPIGPSVRGDFESMVIRPFPTSRTGGNLRRERAGVFHVVDDVDLIARTAVGDLAQLPPLLPAHCVPGKIIASACRAYEFRVTTIDDQGPRARMSCEVRHQHRFRDFLGYNRARHAIIEAAILATRLHLVDRAAVIREFERLAEIVGKTGGEREQSAFLFLSDFVQSRTTARIMTDRPEPRASDEYGR